LNPIEEAMGYQVLNTEYGMSHEEIGQRVGRSRVNITNVIRILQLPAEIQRGLVEGKLTVGHARAILMIPDEEKQLRFYNHMLEEGLTVRKAETRARRIQRQMKINDPMRKKTRGRPQLALKYDGLLEEKFGHVARVKFNELKNRFEVFFLAFSEKEAEDLINRLLGEQSAAMEYPEDQDETEV
jgi:ParB family transcriptional regulator, chromosome partitioning protein